MDKNLQEILNGGKNRITRFSKIGSDEAKYIIDNVMFHRQRKLKLQQVRFLTKKILTREYKPVSPISFALFNNNVVCINGQHTLHAIIAANKPIDVLLVFSPDDAIQSYTVIDAHSKRSQADAVSAIKDWTFTNSQLRVIGSACRLMLVDSMQGKGSKGIIRPVDIAAKIDEHENDFRAYNDLVIKNKNKVFLKRVPLSIYLRMKVSINPDLQDKVDEFWNGVISGEMLSSGDARKLLRERYLKGLKSRNGILHKSLARDAGEAAYVLAHWEAFCKNIKQINSDYIMRVWRKTPNMHGSNIKIK